MNSFIVLFLLATFGNALPLDSIDNKVDLNCRTVTAYLGGTFQNPKNQEQTFDAEFLIRLDISNPNYHISIEYWNQSLSSSRDVIVAFDSSQTWTTCSTNDRPCSMSRKLDSDYLLFSIWKSYPAFGFYIFKLSSSLSYFALPNAQNGCTNNIPYPTGSGANQQADTTLFRFCACCGDYKPDPALKCPANPLNSHT
ncbi:hypothetical protein M3Y97_00941300 [Aphelenchoides bicaudatus]|nr:hypothetical protein M3Y97_00941300 [Aphelenchoides bicaudatus]